MKKLKGGETWIQPISSVEKIVQKMAPIPPPVQSIQGPEVGGNIDVLSTIIASLNTNPYLIGILMLLLNLGGRFLSFELTKKQEAFLQQAWLRPLIFFTVIFVATRNLAVAFWVTLFFFFVIWVVANENSPFCLIPGWRKQSSEQNPIDTYASNMNLLHQFEIHHDAGHSEQTSESQGTQ